MTVIEDILKDVPDKQYRWKGTTSLKWKKDLYTFAKDRNFENVLELGTNYGWTSYLASFISKQVYTVEYNQDTFHHAKEVCKDRDNITFILGDAYKDETYRDIPKEFDAVIIDCIHDYSHVKKDIRRALSYQKKDSPIYLIFDDYSHPTAKGVREAIDEFTIKNKIFRVHYIGHSEGHIIHRNDESHFTLIGPEGLIVEYDG